jgi:YHS domain-containing protein
MNKSLLLQTLVWPLLLLLGACAAIPGKISVTEPVPALNAPTGVALEGYDSVAYFTDGKPIKGDDAYAHQWHGVQWKFSSPEHQAAFAAEPERYAPQYGGYCAFAVSRGTTADGDPHQWAIVGDKLYVNNNAFAMQLWNQDRSGNIEAADVNWPLIPKQITAADTPPGTPDR